MNPGIRLLAALSILFFAGCQQGAAGPDGRIALKKIKTSAELEALTAGGEVLVVHALDAEHYAKGHVPGAVNIDYEKMKPDILPADKDRALVFYCAGGMCPVSDWAAKKAIKWGHTDVTVYKGGIKDWKAAGMKVGTGN